MLRSKGAETWGLLLWFVDQLESAENRCDAMALRILTAARALVRLVRVFQTSALVMTPEEISSCRASLIEHLIATEENSDEVLVPKRHLLCHLIDNLGAWGNPRGYANWEDEHLNKLLKKACKNASQLAFDKPILLRMRWMLDKAFAKRPVA